MAISEKIKVSAIIAAAGCGRRMGGNYKQFLLLDDKPLVIYSLEVMEKSPLITEIILVIPLEKQEYCEQEILYRSCLSKLKCMVAGGPYRQDSVYNGLQAVESGKKEDIVIVHDGVRPFLTERMIERTVGAARKYGATTVAVPVRETIKEADDRGIVVRTLDRTALWTIQTPQAFHYSLLRDAHDKARSEGYRATDDAVLVERMGIRPVLVMGSYDNIKITDHEDLALAEAILRRQKSYIQKENPLH